MSRSHGLVELFCRGIVGAQTDVMFKKDLKFGAKRSGKEFLLGGEHGPNDARFRIRQEEIAFLGLL
jgi:hypothetical protein